MRRYVGAVLAAGFAVLAPIAVRADQVVYFTNGTSMEIRGHTVDGSMVRVDLGGGSMLGFPNSMVERIEDRGKRVYTNPAFRPANQAVAGSSSSGRMPERDTTAITGVPPGARMHAVGPRPPGGIDPNDRLVQAAYGDAGVPSVPRPQVAAAGNGRIKIRGRMNAESSAGAPIGTVPQSNNYAIDTGNPGNRTGVQITTMQPREGPPAPPPDPVAEVPAPEVPAPETD